MLNLSCEYQSYVLSRTQSIKTDVMSSTYCISSYQLISLTKLTDYNIFMYFNTVCSALDSDVSINVTEP